MNSTQEGTHVKVLTRQNKTIEAILYAFDPKINTIVLQTPSDKPLLPHHSPHYNFLILNAQQVKEFKVLSPTATPLPIKPVNSLNMDKLQVRERNALRSLEKSLSSIGIGVSKEAQEIFNALSRTYPCRWDKQNIVVMDEVTITPPYTPANCSGPPNGAIDRLKVVV